jgi:hypothetical protein
LHNIVTLHNRNYRQEQLKSSAICHYNLQTSIVQVIRELNRDFIEYETGLGINISAPTQNQHVTTGPIESRGRFRTHPRSGDRIVAIVRFRTFYAPQQTISFDRASSTWNCKVWCNADEKTPHEYDLLIARISDDLEMLFRYYSRVHEQSDRWIPFELTTTPSGLEILASVTVSKR